MTRLSKMRISTSQILFKGLLLLIFTFGSFTLYSQNDTLELKVIEKNKGNVIINKYYHKSKGYLVVKEKFKKGKKIYRLEYKSNGKIIRSENRKGVIREHKDCGCK
jgi:hypothetical protein